MLKQTAKELCRHGHWLTQKLIAKWLCFDSCCCLRMCDRPSRSAKQQYHHPQRQTAVLLGQRTAVNKGDLSISLFSLSSAVRLLCWEWQLMTAQECNVWNQSYSNKPQTCTFGKHKCSRWNYEQTTSKTAIIVVLTIIMFMMLSSWQSVGRVDPVFLTNI